MKTSTIRTIAICIGIVGAILAIAVIILMANFAQSEESSVKVTLTEVPAAEYLKAELKTAKAELEATRKKLGNMKRGRANLALEKEVLVKERNQLLAAVAELRINQQPEVTELFSQLKERYKRQTTELNELKALHNATLLKYEALIREHSLCVDK